MRLKQALGVSAAANVMTAAEGKEEEMKTALLGLAGCASVGTERNKLDE